MHALFSNVRSSGRFSGTLLPFLLIPLLTFSAGCEKKRAEVNLEQAAVTGGSSQPQDLRPPLNIAVGAMISPETTRTYYEELLSHIADRMGKRAVFSQRRTYAEVNDLVRKKEVDFAFVCAGPYTQGKKEFGMELLAVPVSNNKTVYHSYIIVGSSSPLKSFNDLKGKKFAFTDPQSNTGALVPTYMLAKMGETPQTFFKEYFYSHSHDNSIKAVAEGQADGAAVDSLIWEFMNKIDPALTSRTRIVEKSPPYGIPPIVVHPGLDAATKKQLKEILLTLNNDKQAKPLLEKIQIDRFVEGNDSMYNTVREMNSWIEQKTVK
jgi:phosphonate transport system substrate-binding protein